MTKNKLWRVLALGLTLVMMLPLLAACSEEDDGTFKPDKLEQKSDVTIIYNQTTEAETKETKQGEKRVSEAQGYAIYILDGFTFTPGDEVDTITMNDNPDIKMTIRQADENVAQEESGYDEATEMVKLVERKRFNDSTKLVEFAMSFPISEIEGKARYLYAMKDSLRNGN